MEKDILEIAKIIDQNSGKLYLVGGAVRDFLLNKEITDEDYCVTGIEVEKFQELFPEAKLLGKSFQVFNIYGKEFAMARTETKTQKGHNGFFINTDKNISIERDLQRRDITINSIAKDVLTGEIIDPYNGRADLNNKIIRATSNAFLEDPLRTYRVARFASILNFEVDKDTIRLMNKTKSELNNLSKERVFVELKKALESEKPSIFFNVLREGKVLEIHFKEIYDLIGALQPIEYHPEGDAYNHTMMALDKCAQLTNNVEIRYATLVHDLGKGTTPKEEYPHHYNHEVRGVELVENLSERIGVPNKWKDFGKVACREHMRGGIFYKMKPSKKVDFIERVNKSNLGLEGLQLVVLSDKLSSRNIEEKNIKFDEIGRRCIKEINGEYIKNKYNISEGKMFGEKLRQERIEWISKYT